MNDLDMVSYSICSISPIGPSDVSLLFDAVKLAEVANELKLDSHNICFGFCQTLTYDSIKVRMLFSISYGPVRFH